MKRQEMRNASFYLIAKAPTRFHTALGESSLTQTS